MYEEYELASADGRRLQVGLLGPRTGTTVVVHHGTPAAASILRLFEPATAAGVLLVAISRPGYGTSARRPGRSVAGAVEDVRAVLDALGRDRYVAVGWSGGGPHALACAALDAPRCAAAWCLAGVAPADADFDWLAGMAEENVEEFALAREGGERFEEVLEAAAVAMRAATGPELVGLLGTLIGEADRAALASGRVPELMAAATAQALVEGAAGWIDDDRALLAPWGFDLAHTSVPVEVWTGGDDRMVPPAHGAWIAARIPGARLVHHVDAGHISLVVDHLSTLASAWAAVDTDS